MFGVLLAAATVAVLTPRQKAELLIVSGLPAQRGVGGVLVQRWNVDASRPPGALVFTDQEGGAIKTFPSIPPWTSAEAVTSETQAYESGETTGRELRRKGVDVDLAPVLDLSDGPLGSRQFRAPLYAIAFARGLAAVGEGACAKHFPGLGPLPVSTDARLYDRGVLRDRDVAPYRDAVEADLPCVMVGHGIYPNLGPRRATLEPNAYRLLRSLGFDGVAITDSLGVLGDADAPLNAVEAVRAGADLVLFTSGVSAARAVHALVPLARRGELDAHVARVLLFRERYG